MGTLDSLTATDRVLTLDRGGIQPAPQLVFIDSDRPVMLVGPQTINGLDLLNPVRRRSWTD